MDQLDEYIRFNCPGCGRRLKAKAEHVGKKVRCTCGRETMVTPLPESPGNEAAARVPPRPAAATPALAAARQREAAPPVARVAAPPGCPPAPTPAAVGVNLNGPRKTASVKKSLQDLEASDFPGVDAGRFSEFKQAVAAAQRSMWICLGIAAAIIVIILVATGTLLIPGVVPLLIALWLVNRKANRLGKELGITRASIKQALARAKLAGSRSPPVGAPPAPVARPAPASPQPAASPQAAALTAAAEPRASLR